MKKLLLPLILITFIASCSKNDDGNTTNPYLPDYSFDTVNLINTSLPQYSHLTFANNFLILDDYGINGVVLFYAGGSNYSAFELSDPNHQLLSCSYLTVDGVIATCDCDDGNSYEILNGLGREGTTGQYVLKRYFVEPLGNIIRVYNN